jgi:hypothetical protein
MGLLNKDLKSNTSAYVEDIKEKFIKYFPAVEKDVIEVKNNSIISYVNFNHLSKYAYLASSMYLEDLINMQSEMPFLTKFHAKSSLSLNLKGYKNKQSDAPFSICSDKQISIYDTSIGSNIYNLSNTIIKCHQLILNLYPSHIENVTLRTGEIHIALYDPLDKLYSVNGDIKTKSLFVYVNNVDAFDNILGACNELRVLFNKWISGLWYPEREDIIKLKQINPIELLGLGYYNAMYYHFKVGNRVLTITKDNRLNHSQCAIEMANEWYIYSKI